jgi:aspartate/methionine/tyrosine aminotransferase
METIKVPQATFYLWLPIPPWAKNCEDFCNDLLETSGVVTVPGTAFGQYGEGFFRMSLVDTPDKLQEAIERMQTDGFTYNK